MTQDLNLYTMQTLFEQPVEPVDFIVEGLLAPGLYILGGSPKVGKSWLPCSSAWRCAQAHLFWEGQHGRARCSISHWRTVPSGCIPVRCV